jgi:hypothetical protein
MPLRRTIAAAAVTLGIALAGLPVPAQAAPPDPAPIAALINAPVKYKHTPSVSKSQMVGLKIARSVANSTKGRTLDYKFARKKFGSHYIYRRQFAGSWVAAGGSIKNISAAERKKVYKYRIRARVSSAAISAKAGNCTGDTAFFSFGSGSSSYHFFDSCATNNLKANLTFCMTGAGFTAALFRHEGVSVSVSILIAACGVSSTWISTAQSNSAKNAIVIICQNFYNYSNGRYRSPVVIKPQ